MVGTLQGHIDEILCLAFSPSGKLLASGSEDNTIKLWDLANRTIAATLEGHSDGICTAVPSNDGELLASSGARDQNVEVWEVNRGTIVKTIDVQGNGLDRLRSVPTEKL